MTKKTALLAGLLMALNMSVFAQEKSKLSSSDRFIMDVFTDFWQNYPQEDLKPAAINRGIAFHLMVDKPLGFSNFSIAAGLGYAGHNLYSKSLLVIATDENAASSFAFTPIAEGVKFSKNKINVNYLELPLELRFRTKKTSQKFRVHAGVKLGYLINAHTKYKGEPTADYQGYNNNSTVKKHFTNNEEVNAFRYGAIARIGYGQFNLNAFYALNPLFKKDKGPEMFPISIGLSYIPF